MSNIWGGCWVACQKCTCRLGLQVIQETRCGMFNNTDEAAAAWNKRGKR